MTEFNEASVSFAKNNYKINAVRFDFNCDCISDLFDKRFEDKLTLLSKNDQDLSIRNAAIKALENNYSNMEPITDE